MCPLKTKPDWLIDYGTNCVALLCNKHTLEFNHARDKLLTYSQFMNDEYLLRIICSNKRYIYYVNTHTILKRDNMWLYHDAPNDSMVNPY